MDNNIILSEDEKDVLIDALEYRQEDILDNDFYDDNEEERDRLVKEIDNLIIKLKQ